MHTDVIPFLACRSLAAVFEAAASSFLPQRLPHSPLATQLARQFTLKKLDARLTYALNCFVRIAYEAYAVIA